MAKRIEKLRSDQIAQFGPYVEKWTGIGLCTEPANRQLAEDGVRLAYRTAGLDEPRIVWCSSPLAMALTRAIVLHGMPEDLGALVNKSIGASVWDSVGASVWDSVGASVWDSVRDSVRASVGDSVGASVRDSVWDSVGASVWDSVSKSGYGQHDANWIAFYTFFREQCGLSSQTEKLRGLRLLTEHAGWYLPHEHICWISERTNIVHQDSQHRLHCETGPALSYPDGWSLYRWHGITVPDWVIEQPETITRAHISGEQNAEVRRVMLLKYGLDRYLRDTNAVAIDSDHDLHGPRTLYRLQDALGPITVVQLTNSTSESDGSLKTYVVRVDPSVTTCRGALCWMYGLKDDAYAPVLES